MARSSNKKKAKASPKSAKGARGNHAAFFSPLPPTPPRKNKRPRVESDSEPEEEEPAAKQKKPSEKTAPHRRRVDNADHDASAPGDQHRQQRKSGAPNRNPLPSPRPSSPSPPEPATSSRRDPSPSSRSSSRRDRAPRNINQHDSTRHDTAQDGSTQRDGSNAQSRGSSGRLTSNTAAPQRIPSNPGRLFADQLKHMSDLDSQFEDLDDLDLDEAAPKAKKGKIKPSKAAVDDEDEEMEDASEDDEADGSYDYDLRLNNEDDEELSAEAVDELMAVIHSRKKQKYSLTKKQSDPERLPGHFKKWGRNAHRLLGVYTNIHQTITTGMMVLKARPSTAEEYAQAYKAVPNTSAAAAKFYTKKFMYLCKVVPKLKALCGHLLYRSGDMFVFAKFFKKHAGAGRSSDLSTLKRNFASYLPRVSLSARNGGYFSVCTGRLILPIHERDAFDENPVEYNKLRANEHRKHARKNKRCKDAHTSNDDQSYPGFLFPTHFDYDELAPHHGLFKNTLCESVVRHLYKGPSSVGLSDGAPNLGRTCLADIYSITKLTPDYLVYAATLIRHLLSVDGRWSGDDKRRSGHRFHTSLHRLLTLDYEMWEEDVESGDLFDDEATPWLTENIFSYYNRLIFGAEEGDPEEQAKEASDFDDDDDDDMRGDCDTVRARALSARKAELEDMRLRRLNAKLSRAPSEMSQRSRTPSEQPQPSRALSQLRAQSIDYEEPHLQHISLTGGADNKLNDEAEAGDNGAAALADA
uniref:MAP kinase kinase kinase (EC) n=1 Tax=Ganoderma boninense TaxID=34458 RepID=A0A5K1K7X5_9APHY|nr:MAP kinase kinase kinase (EC [Ganoderma boninense]